MKKKYVATCSCGCGCGVEVVAWDEGSVSFLSSDFAAMQAAPLRRAAQAVKTAVGLGGTLREIALEKEDLEKIRDVLATVTEDDVEPGTSSVEFDCDEFGLLWMRLAANRGKKVLPWKTYRAYEVTLSRADAAFAIKQIDRALKLKKLIEEDEEGRFSAADA